MPVRFCKRVIAGGCFALVSALLCTEASAQGSGLAGKYTASPTTVIAEVSAWGEDCGVRPTSQTLTERPTVEVRENGSQLELKFPDRTLRSNGCWSQNPAVKLTASAAGNGQWKAECATAQGDSKRELGRYTISATSPTMLELREENEYLWQLKNSRCTAKVRTIQRLERGLVAPTPTATTEPTAPAIPEVAAPACVPGPVVRIKLRPQDAKIQPGQRVCFSPRGFDAKGCPSELEAKDLEWTLDKAEGLRGTLAGGCFRASDSTAEAEGIFRVTASREGKRDQASITVAIADLSDITARRDQDSPNRLAEENSVEGGLAGAGVKAVGVQSGAGLGLIFGGLAALLMLASVAWWLWSRRQVPTGSLDPSAELREVKAPIRENAARVVPVDPSPPYAPEHAAPAAAAARAHLPGAVGGEPMICPQCRRGYPAGSVRCESEGARLVTYASFVQQSKTNETRTCAGCGERLDPDAMFCGACGLRV